MGLDPCKKDIIEAKLTYLSGKMEANSAINPLFLLSLTLQGYVSFFAILLSYLINMVNFKLIDVQQQHLNPSSTQTATHP